LSGSLRAERGVLAEEGVRLALGLRVGDLDRLELAFREAGQTVPLWRKLALEAADHDRGELVAVRHDPTGEPLVVQHLQQGGEALRIAVVRGRREEEAVLEVGRDSLDRPRAVRIDGVLASSGRSYVLGLVDD